MTAPIQQAIARLRPSRDGPVIGTAFLISPTHVMTCAHVVNEALCRPPDNTPRPSDSDLVWLEFPLARAPAPPATVTEWWPMSRAAINDIAVLALKTPITLRPYRLASTPPAPGS